MNIRTLLADFVDD